MKEITISKHKDLFSKRTIQAVSSEFVDNVYVLLDTDNDSTKITFCQKGDADLKQILLEFNNRLIQFESDENNNQQPPDSIVVSEADNDNSFDQLQSNLRELETSSLEDPLGISDAWGDTQAEADKKNTRTINATNNN